MSVTKENQSNLKVNVFPAISKLLCGVGDEMNKYIKGQTHAIYCIQEALFEAFTLKETDYKGPKVSILMTGLPGVGKTQLIEEIAKYLMLPYFRANMSSYSDKEEGVFNFKGINESYKASRPGDVTKFVDENPNGILLLDEVDKAHQNVLGLLYQVLEGGELEDAYMRKKVSFKNTIIFMTTNVGAKLFQDLDRYNYATLSQIKIINALKAEKNPITNAPCFNSALVSRFAKGKIVPFNRLSGQLLCEMTKGKAEELFERFHERYPKLQLECDSQNLAKTLMLSKGGEVDARGLTGEVEHFFGTHLFEVMQKYEENQQDFSKLAKVQFSFNFFDGDERVKQMFDTNEHYRIAVYCSAEEREQFSKCLWLDFDFVSMEDNVTSLNYDCAIVSVDLEKNEKAAQCFRRVKKQEDLPVYVFSLNENMDKIDMKTYYCEGAESAFLPKDGVPFLTWLDEITKSIHFARVALDLGRANLVLRYDTSCSYEMKDEQAVLSIKTVNYRLERVIHAQDEGLMVADHEIPKVKFTDVKGLDSTLVEVKSLTKILKNHKEHARLGIKSPKGLLLYGVPGTGKTLIAKALAAESDMPFIQRNATEYLKPLVGESEQMLREDFARARKYAPTVLFIDEVDAIAKRRGRANATETSETILNALLSEMDGFIRDDKKPVFVIAATNFEPSDDANGLDPAFVRRFDRTIRVQLPNAKGRMEILQYFLGKYSVSFPEEKLENFVQRSFGKSPADIERIVDCAARQSFGREMRTQDLEEAFETISYGEKKEWSAEIARKTSFHEAGHTLVAWMSGHTPAYVTNISRGAHGGYMQYESGEEKFDYTRQEILDRICVSFAGRAAEELIYGSKGVTTGANADIIHARNLAKALVDDYAMDMDFLLGMGDVQSETTKKLFDEKVNSILKAQYARAKQVLTAHQEPLKRLTDKLMEENSLEARQIDELLKQLINKEVEVKKWTAEDIAI